MKQQSGHKKFQIAMKRHAGFRNMVAQRETKKRQTLLVTNPEAAFHALAFMSSFRKKG